MDFEVVGEITNIEPIAVGPRISPMTFNAGTKLGTYEIVGALGKGRGVSREGLEAPQ